MMNMDKFDSVKPFHEYLNILPFKGNMETFTRKVHVETSKCCLPKLNI